LYGNAITQEYKFSEDEPNLYLIEVYFMRCLNLGLSSERDPRIFIQISLR